MSEFKADTGRPPLLIKQAIGPPDYDQCRTKKRKMEISTCSEAIILENWPVYLVISVAILAGVRMAQIERLAVTARP
jgi:hypothetical protein